MKNSRKAYQLLLSTQLTEHTRSTMDEGEQKQEDVHLENVLQLSQGCLKQAWQSEKKKYSDTFDDWPKKETLVESLHIFYYLKWAPELIFRIILIPLKIQTQLQASGNI